MNRAGSKTVLLTLGRLPVALDLARSFAAAGFRVLVAEPWGMHLARSSSAVDRCFRVGSPARSPGRYLDDLLDIIVAERVDLVVPVSEETLHVAALADRVPDGTTLFCGPQEHVLELHDKLRFVEKATTLGLAAPPTMSGDDAAVADFASTRDVVVKPRHGASGQGVEFLEAGRLAAKRPGLLVQERLRGTEVSSFTIARDGRCLVTLVYRGTITDGSVAVAFERIGDDRIIEWVDAFVRGTGHTGFIAFDFIIEADGRPVAIECNPRATSGMHFIDTGVLAPAILGEALPSRTLRAAARLAESYSCFSVTLGSLFRPAEFRRRRRELAAATDVTWSRDDPWPFLLMMINTSGLLWRALRDRQGFAAAAIRDIGWRAGGEG